MLGACVSFALLVGGAAPRLALGQAGEGLLQQLPELLRYVFFKRELFPLAGVVSGLACLHLRHRHPTRTPLQRSLGNTLEWALWLGLCWTLPRTVTLVLEGAPQLLWLASIPFGTLQIGVGILLFGAALTLPGALLFDRLDALEARRWPASA